MTQGFQAPGTGRKGGGVPVIKQKRQRQELVGSRGEIMSLVFETRNLSSWFSTKPQSQDQAANEVWPSGVRFRPGQELWGSLGKTWVWPRMRSPLGGTANGRTEGQAQKPGKGWRMVF